MVAFQVCCHKFCLPKLHLLSMRRLSVSMVWGQVYIKVLPYKKTASQNSNGQQGSFPIIFRYLTFSKKRKELIDRLPNPSQLAMERQSIDTLSMDALLQTHSLTLNITLTPSLLFCPVIGRTVHWQVSLSFLIGGQSLAKCGQTQFLSCPFCSFSKYLH